MKVLQATICLAALIAVATASSAYWGYRNASDVWLSSDRPYSPAYKGKVTTIRVQFPAVGRVNNRTITAIYVQDLFANSSGAVPKIVSGGIGYKYTTVQLTSQKGQGVNSAVDIYGK